MYKKTERQTLTFFSDENWSIARAKCMSLFDFNLFQQQSLDSIRQLKNEEAYMQWLSFCRHLRQFSENKSEKLLLMRVAFSCLNNQVETGELAQLITLMRHLKSVYGLEIIHLLLKANVPNKERSLQSYLQVSQLLLDLYEEECILSKVRETLPNLLLLQEELHAIQTASLARKYPERDLDSVLQHFSDHGPFVQFPLTREELARIKIDYLALKAELPSLKTTPQSALEVQLKAQAKQWREHHDPKAKAIMLAILAETIRRQFGIFPHDVQLMSILALINTPEKFYDRIGQVRTGEGKSTIFAIINAFVASQGHFVDMVTSSAYLGIRDCKKYQPFYKALGITASHICHHKPKQEHFHAQILYGTNTDFEFAFLRDGLYNRKLRYSIDQQGNLIKRPFDVVVIDEIDNLFLDIALSSAQMGITDYEDLSWIYLPIMRFAQSKSEDAEVTNQLIVELREHINKHISEKYKSMLKEISDDHLKRWYNSACTALFVKKEKRDYVVKEQKDKHDSNKDAPLDITIVDYAFTGRMHHGSQWQHGIHQFLQLKHQLPLTPSSKTAASISHPAYFNLYQHKIGLTGTMGEASERDEIKQIYRVESFDAPPNVPNIRKRHPDYLLATRKEKWESILNELLSIQKNGQPSLVLFKTIEESNEFSEFLKVHNLKHQLLNETQKEDEEYIVGQAGESGMITIATNTAGRGTDIPLSPESKKAGGLEVIFSFYPDNLRVEDQGFGRGGRQGQPGGARMILSLEDETIINLLKMNPLLTGLFELQANLHFSRQKDENQLIPANNLIALLNQLRTQRIQQESAQRFQCSQQEQAHFAKLNEFFTQMAEIYDLVESKEFSQLISTICSSNTYYEQSKNLYDSKNPHWSTLQDMANSLLEKQVEGLTVDWSAFVDFYKETYLDHIRQLWASYYSKLRDEIEVTNRDKAKAVFDSFINAPMEQAQAIIHNILAMGVQSLGQQRGLGM